MYLIFLLVYFAILIFIGIILAKKNIDFNSYFFGNRRLGSFLIFFTITASWIGAATTIATIQQAQKIGFKALWLLCVPTLLTIGVFIFLNKKIWTIHFESLPSLLKKYYGRLVATLAAMLIFFYMILLAASQLVAWGQFMSHFIDENYEITVMIGAIIIVLYSYFGGYLSVVFSDGLQFILLVSAILYMVYHLNQTTSPTITSSDWNFFSPGLEKNILITISFTLAWIISPIIWQRIASAKNRQSSKKGLTYSALTMLLLYVCIIFIAFHLRSFPHKNFAAIIASIFPVAGGLLVFIGIAAALMSTADSAINISALTIIKDLLPTSKKKTIVYARMATLLSGALALLIAFRFNSIIKILGLASEIMAEGLFIPGMYALFFKQKKPWAGLFSLILGGIFSILVFIKSWGISIPLPHWPFSLPYGLGLSFMGFLCGYLIDTYKKKDIKKN